VFNTGKNVLKKKTNTHKREPHLPPTNVRFQRKLYGRNHYCQ